MCDPIEADVTIGVQENHSVSGSVNSKHAAAHMRHLRPDYAVHHERNWAGRGQVDQPVTPNDTLSERAPLLRERVWNSTSARAATVAWYQEHRGWWERILSGDYRSYYARQYGGR